MANPTILINSGGSDTLASGAGPGTALTGTNASTDGAGTTVTLDGSPDLSGVATDGTHVIFLSDATAGARNFSKITAADNSAKTVTVADAFGLSLSGKSWAIGGKRATLDGTNSIKLFSNNGTFGDAMPGWIVQVETDLSLSAVIVPRRAGDNTNGSITIKGDSASTLRVLTQTANTAVFSPTISGILIENFHLKNSNATKTSANGITVSAAAGYPIVRNCVLGDATNRLQSGAAPSTGKIMLEDVEIKETNSHGISSTGSGGQVIARNVWIHNAQSTSHGILLTGTSCVLNISDSLIEDNGGDGINFGNATASSIHPLILERCTIDGNGGDGLEIANVASVRQSIVRNNNFTGNGAYGINSISGTDAITDKQWGYNNFGTGGTANTSGAANNYTLASSDQQVDPGYTNAASNNFAVGTNLKAKGYPDATRTIGANKSSTTSYVDIGAAQRQESSGGAPYHGAMAGGLL